MIKLFLTLLVFALIAAAMLQLREQKREIGYEINQLHSSIESKQAALWNQQLQIAIYTAPNAIARTANYLGRSNWVGDSYYAGSMDEVRIWNVARSTADIRSTMYRVRRLTAAPARAACGWRPR